MNNPTAGETDGTAISQDNAETSPLTVTLDANTNESKIIAIGIRTDEGYKTNGDTVITFTGTTAAKWSICATANGTFADSLIISESITSTNKIFYVKVDSSSDETPSNDISVNIHVVAPVTTV